MFLKSLSDLPAMLLVAGNVDAFSQMAQWRLNEALCDLEARATETGQLPWWKRERVDSVPWGPTICTFTPEGAETFDHTVAELLRRGILERDGDSLDGYFRVTEAGYRLGRARLFGVPAQDAPLLYQAGRRLATRLSASSKNWDRSAASRMSRSCKPGRRRQVSPG